MNPTTPLQAYDFIGDIHGQLGKLTDLLLLLGYEHHPVTGVWHHPGGRIAVFLGDLVDRGPEVRAVVRTVRDMVEAGTALAIMGNHEFNLILYHTPAPWGGWLRTHTADHTRQCAATLAAFNGCEEELADHLEWMKQLPATLELAGCRAVHACWDAGRLPLVAGRTLLDEAFLLACGTPGTPEHQAMENLLKGAEMPLPPGITFEDKDGTARTAVRARWWNLHEPMTLAGLIMPPGCAVVDEPVLWEHLRHLPCYAEDAPPVFFGHYWLPPTMEKAPLAPNLACLDYGAGRNGPLTAYRWNGETRLTADAFVCTR
jgi:hypothetical protein